MILVWIHLFCGGRRTRPTVCGSVLSSDSVEPSQPGLRLWFHQCAGQTGQLSVYIYNRWTSGEEVQQKPLLMSCLFLCRLMIVPWSTPPPCWLFTGCPRRGVQVSESLSADSRFSSSTGLCRTSLTSRWSVATATDSSCSVVQKPSDVHVCELCTHLTVMTHAAFQGISAVWWSDSSSRSWQAGYGINLPFFVFYTYQVNFRSVVQSWREEWSFCPNFKHVRLLFSMNFIR